MSSGTDLVSALRGVHGRVDATSGVVVDERLGLLVIRLKSLLQRLRVVVRTLDEWLTRQLNRAQGVCKDTRRIHQALWC